MYCSLKSLLTSIEIFLEQAPLPETKNKGITPPLRIMDPWMVFIDKANAITVQRYVVQWFIALYGMNK